ncbi:UNVERIFIED_CONTAM: putative DNA helicase MCM8 [Sesamum angustifolium]|uniref:Probable DNA helicase MCM8 n=1 Tax=Sesamum angustifolium TaxID=2727405 RepID=A0AAW2N5G2_9LAMI
MYGHPQEIGSSKTKFRSKGTSDLWRIVAFYFPQISADGSELIFHLTSLLVHFFSSSQGQQFIDQVKEDDGLFILPLDFQQFRKVCEVEEFYAALEEKPKDALLCMNAAVHEVIFEKADPGEDSIKINVRLHNYQDSMIALKNLKAAYIDRLVSVRGTVIKVSTVRPLVIQMSFSCAKCGTTITCDFPDGKFSPPTKCEMQACKSRNFNPIRSTARPIDFQKIRIQELLRSEHHEEGRVPRTVECELTEDLVDTCIPGDVVTVTGIIRVINNYMDIGGGKSKGKNQTLYYLYLEVVSITNSKSQSVPEDMQHTDTNARATEHSDLYSFSPRDLEFIVKFSEEHGSDVFRQILHSICPSIYGHELVKAGITLALFGGVQKHSRDQNKVPVRGDIHIIVVESRDIRGVDLNVKNGSLMAKLRLDPKRDSDFVPLPGPLLRKYIAYARTYVFPRMTKPAAEILQKFYLRLRDHNTSADGTPITARQLESLVRLAEARARVDLREEISTQDALDVVEIMKESLYDKYVDENGFVDFGRSGGMSQQKEAKRFLSALNKQSEIQQKDCFSISEIYSLADRIGLRVPDIDTFVDNLNSVGYLLKKGPKTYQVLSSSYSRSQSSKSR